MRRSFPFALLIVLAVALTSCAAPAPTPVAAPQPTEPVATTVPAASAAMTATSTMSGTAPSVPSASAYVTPTNLSGKLTLAGSSALLPLMQFAAQNLQQANKDLQISVTAGGSGAGRQQVCAGQIDIGDSDVPLSDSEKTSLKCADAVQTPVAIQAFVAVASKQGPGSVTSLSQAQLQGIFSGQITNWKQVGGDDQVIVLINRLKGSGTRAQMANYLFKGDDTKFAAGQSEEDNSATVLQTVGQTPGAVSYLSVAYVDDTIVAFNIDNLQPTSDNIQSGKWPIGGPGYAITKGQPTALEQAFLSYVLNPTLQNSPEFAKLGFVPVAH